MKLGIFSDEAVNPGRQEEADLLRGFTALVLIIVHAGLYLGNCVSRGYWVFCDIIGSEFSAPVLMGLMGIGMVYSRHQQPKDLLKRGVRLFTLGYALNFFRSLLPLWLLGNVDEWASAEAFFVVDILPFAGLSFLFLALLKGRKLSHLWIFAISLALAFLNQWMMLPSGGFRAGNLLTGLVNLFCPVTEWSCFPFFTWFIFPAFGLVFGTLLTHCKNKNRLYGILLPVGLCGVLYVYLQFHCLYPDYTSYYWGNNFYYMGIKNVLLTLTFICFALSFWFFAGKILPDFAKKFLGFLSRNLNTYYIISWLLISALMHAQAIYGWQFGTGETVGITALVTAACIGLTELWLRVKSMGKKQNIH